MRGSSVSVMITICVLEVLLPLASAAVQVTKLVPMGKTPGASFAATARPQLSLSRGVPRTTFEAEHWPASALATTSAGHTSVGGVVSATVTKFVLHIALPEESNAARTTVV